MRPRAHPRLAFPLTMLVLFACRETTEPTHHEEAGSPAPAVSMAAAANSWTSRAPTLFGPDIYGFDLGAARNSAGQSIVYTFGGTSSDEGGTGTSVTAYNVATDTWTRRTSQVGVYDANGVGKIGSRLYFSGGYVDNEASPDASRQLWAYDYSRDRMIQKANLPIFSAEGVSGVINGKLYVLPGTCNGNGYPNPGYCAEERTRRFYRYDPGMNSWVARRQAPHFHRSGAAAVLYGKLYVAGGFKDYEPVTDLDVYDPATNTWRTLAPMPTGGAAQGAALQGKFYVVVSHYNGTTPDHRAYAYNPVTNKWILKAAPAEFGSITRVVLDGRVRLFTATGDKSALYTP